MRTGQAVERLLLRRTAKGEEDTYCRPCRSAYGKEHYAANRQRYIDLEAKRKRARAEKRMLFLLEYLRENPCADCGEADPLVLEFDHIARRTWRSELDFQIETGKAF